MAKQKKHSKRMARLAPIAKHFYFFFGLLVLVMPVFYLNLALDRTLMPRLLALSLLLLVTNLLVFNKKTLVRWDFSIFRHKLLLFWMAFFIITVVSAFFAFNPMESYFFIIRNFLFVAGLAMAAVILANTPGWSDKMPKLFIIAAAIAVVIGLVQYYSRVYLATETLLPDGRALIYRVTGMFSHKNFFSSALILMLPFTAFGSYRYRGRWQLAAVLSSLAILLMIVLLSTRSVWLGAFLGTLLAALLLITYRKSFGLEPRWRKMIYAGLLTGAVGIALIFAFGDASDEFSIPGRVKSIVDPQSHHNIHRINIWHGSLDMIRERPVTGVGAGNWCIHIPKRFDHRFEQLEALGWRQPHNDFIWIASEQGIIGIVLYLVAFGVMLFYLIRIISSKKEKVKKEHKVFALLLLAGLTAYLIDSFFSFPYERIDIMTLLMIISACTLVLYHQLSPKPAYMPKRLVFLVSGLLAFIFSAYYSQQSIKMELNLGRALSAMRSAQHGQMLYYANAAKTPFRSLGPHLYPPEFLEGVAYQNQEQYRRAVASFEKARAQAPHDIRILHLLAKNLRDIGEYSEADKLFREIVGIFPPSSSIIRDIKELAVTYYQEGAYREAHDLLMIIPGWEEDAEIMRNIRALDTLMQREAENQ